MDDLTKALMLAGEELAREHSWCFDGDPGCPPLDDNPFITVVRKHVEPMVDAEGWRSARIAALKAELALLESTPNVKVRGPEAALSPEAPSLLPGCAARILEK